MVVQQTTPDKVGDAASTLIDEPDQLPIAKPKTPYADNVLGRFVWLRPKLNEKFWIRGRIVRCEQSRVAEIGGKEEISSIESIIHVVRCVDDNTTYKVELQKMEQSKNLRWW
jgi:hypothetical protein